jgi:SAM-dependent methyltransferase
MDFQQPGNFEHGWYRAKNKLISYLLTGLKPASGDWVILDIGCGPGEQLKLYEKFGRVVGLDINPGARQINNSIITADIETYQLPANTYNLICCFDMLEHLKNDAEVLANCWQALKPGGYLLLTTSAYNWLFSSHDKAAKHQRRYYYKELKNKLKTANFTLLQLYYWNSLLFFPIAVLRLIKKLLNWQRGYELSYLPSWMNNFVYSCLLFENWLIKNRCHLPWGLSLYAVAKKNEN